MNEGFAREVRLGLVELLDPERGGFPAWEGSPASARIRPPIRWLSGRRAVLAAALLSVLLVVSGLIVAGALRLFDEAPKLPSDSLDRHSRTLVPTGIVTTTTAVVQAPSAVMDGSGDVWFFESGLLLQHDPESGATRSWTGDDDLAFASDATFPARRGGVWLTSSARRTLTWFDGTRVRDEIALPPGIGPVFDIAEATDDVIWLATAEGVFRWSGSSWTDGPAGRPADGATALAIDGDGVLWTANAHSDGSGSLVGAGVSSYDGSAWTTFGARHLAELDTVIGVLEASPDGTLWGFAGLDRIIRFDGATWEKFDVRELGLTPRAFAVTGDGEIRATAGSCAGGRALVADFATGTWQRRYLEFGPRGARCTWAVLVRDTVFAVVDGRLDRFADGALSEIWPGDEVSDGPVGAASVAAVSGREAWAYARGLWHWLDDHWIPESAEAGLPDRLLGNVRLALAPDGRLWLLSDSWVGVREGGRWTRVEKGADTIAFGPDGSVWLGPEGRSSSDLRVLRPVGGAWASQPVPPPPLNLVSSIAVAADGTSWATASDAWFPTDRCLARYDGKAWASVRPLGDGRRCLATVAASPTGDVWANILVESASGDPWPYRSGVWRFDGEIWKEEPEAAALVGIGQIAAAEDGTLWALGLGGLVRFDGARWTVENEGAPIESFSVAPDGSVWVISPVGIQRFTDGGGRS